MIEFEPAVQYVLANEGGISENANDPGGTTNMGISLRFLRSLPGETLKTYGLSGNPETINKADIEQLTPAQAKSIYRGEFWNHAPFDKINNQKVGNYIFDMAVNAGIATSIKCIQRACWAINPIYFTTLIDDGVMGDKTLGIVNQCGSFLLMAALKAERAAHYRMEVQKNPALKEFLPGWMARTYKD